LRAWLAEPSRATVNKKAVVALPSPNVEPPSPKNFAPPSQPKQLDAFSQLSKSINDLPPEEQVRRIDRHFGVFRGARPPMKR
jgi:hypothetical protein